MASHFFFFTFLFANVGGEPGSSGWKEVGYPRFVRAVLGLVRRGSSPAGAAAARQRVRVTAWLPSLAVVTSASRVPA